MVASVRKNRNRIAVLSCFFAAISTAGFAVQGSSIVQLDDDSDWWSISRSNDLQNAKEKFQDRAVADSNFIILGVDITKGPLSQSDNLLGDASMVSRGNGPNARAQKCYTSKDKVFLVFEEGESNSAFYLFSETTPWNGVKMCARAENLSKSAATDSGLQLGQTEEDVIKILGDPTSRHSNELLYLLDSRKPTPPEKLAQLRNDNAGLGEKEFQDKFGMYDTTVIIRAKFSHSKMEYLAVSESVAK